MDIGVAIVVAVIAFIVGAVFASQDHNEIKEDSGEVKRLKEELEAVRAVFGDAGARGDRLSTELAAVSKERDNYRAAFHGVLEKAAAAMDGMIARLPNIPLVENMLKKLKPDEIKSLDLAWGAEFQGAMTQLVGQRLEAVAKLDEAGTRLALGMHLLQDTGAASLPTTDFIGELFAQMQQKVIDYAPFAQMPGFREYFAEATAVTMERILAAHLNGQKRPDPALTKLFQAAYEDANIKHQLREHQHEDLPQSVQSARAPDITEVVITPPIRVSEVSANGNGSHKKG